MKLPSYGNAIVSETKITGYLLSVKHRDGRSKAEFFAQLGFMADAWEKLAKALLQHAAENEVAKVEDSPFGKRYIVEGKLFGSGGKTAVVRSVWFIENRRAYSAVCDCLLLAKEDRMIKELDSVVLNADLPEYGLKRGDIGTVVLIHGDGKGYEVEFVSLDGETMAVVAVLPSQVRPIGRREIAHARAMESMS